MPKSRLLHAVVLAGASWGASVTGCSASDEGAPPGEGTDASAPAADGARDGGEGAHTTPDGGWPPTK